MKTHLQLSIFLSCIGTLSTGYSLFLPTAHACDMQAAGSAYSNCVNQRDEQRRKDDAERYRQQQYNQRLQQQYEQQQQWQDDNNNSSYRRIPEPEPSRSNSGSSSGYRPPPQPTARDYTNAGDKYSNAGNYHAAVNSYSQAIELEPNKPGHYESRAYLRTQSGDKQGAINDYTQVINFNSAGRNPGSSIGYHIGQYRIRGNLYLDLGKYQEAINDYNYVIQITERHPNEYEPSYTHYKDRGITRYRSGDKEGSIADYTKAISLNPKDAVLYGNRGDSYRDLGRDKEAIADYGKAADIKPKAYYFKERANAHYRLGEKEVARAYSGISLMEE